MFFESKANKHSKFTALIAKNAGVYTVFAMSRKCGRRKDTAKSGVLPLLDAETLVFRHFFARGGAKPLKIT